MILTSRLGQRWHQATAVFGLFGLIAQLVLSLSGVQVPAGLAARPGIGLRFIRFFCYFTIQSNLLVLVGVLPLALGLRGAHGSYDRRWWRVVRLAGLVGITVTGIVHWFLLRDPDAMINFGWFVDRVLHLVVPVLAVVGWLLFGPRPRIDAPTIRGAVAWPVLWLISTLTVGGVTGWVPYPFLDAEVTSAGTIVLTLVGITVMFLGLAFLAWWSDRRLPGGRPSPDALPRTGGGDQSKIGPTVRDRLSSKNPE